MNKVIKLTIIKGKGYDKAIDEINEKGHSIINAYTDHETDDFIIEYTITDIEVN